LRGIAGQGEDENLGYRKLGSPGRGAGPHFEGLETRGIYGVTKAAAEDLCHLFHRNQGLACIVLRTSRFFPEEDDDKAVRQTYADDNVKLNEYLFRRVDLEDVVNAHLLAAKHAPAIGFRRYIISATTPFLPEDLPEPTLIANGMTSLASLVS
jgi:nucleoside-diphosphate-sugar epimerase